MNKLEKQWTAESLLALANEHKERCGGGNCRISLYMIGRLYSDLVGRNLTQAELNVFS